MSMMSPDYIAFETKADALNSLGEYIIDAFETKADALNSLGEYISAAETYLQFIEKAPPSYIYIYRIRSVMLRVLSIARKNPDVQRLHGPAIAKLWAKMFAQQPGLFSEPSTPISQGTPWRETNRPSRDPAMSSSPPRRR